MEKMTFKSLKNFAKKKKNLNRFHFINYYYIYIFKQILLRINYNLKTININNNFKYY